MSLVEFPGILLPSFLPTLQALQDMSRQGNVLFAEYLVPPSANMEEERRRAIISPPTYALSREFAFDISSLLADGNGQRLTLSPHQPFDFWTLQDSSTFDDAQAVALVNALCRQLALIQGPSGTGKSYTGVDIIKALLQNRQQARHGPIVCVCYTNHALDQLLEHLAAYGVQQIARLSSCSKSMILEPYNLRAMASKQIKTGPEKHHEWKQLSTLEENLKELTGLFAELRGCDSRKRSKHHLEATYRSHHDKLFGVEEDGHQVVRSDKNKGY
jgi:hypothetical protein